MAVKKNTTYKQGYKGKLKKGQLMEVDSRGKKRKITGQHTMAGTSWYKIEERKGRFTSIQCYAYDKQHGLVE